MKGRAGLKPRRQGSRRVIDGSGALDLHSDWHGSPHGIHRAVIHRGPAGLQQARWHRGRCKSPIERSDPVARGSFRGGGHDGIGNATSGRTERPRDRADHSWRVGIRKLDIPPGKKVDQRLPERWIGRPERGPEHVQRLQENAG